VDSEAGSAVRRALEAAGAAGPVRTFTEPVPTAAAAAAVLGCDVGAIANSLVCPGYSKKSRRYVRRFPDAGAAPGGGCYRLNAQLNMIWSWSCVPPARV
jgi:hypothetical protein